MGIGHASFLFKYPTNLSHGGSLRTRRCGRGYRPLSTRKPLHVVFKINKHRLRGRSFRSPRNFALTKILIRKWAKYFGVGVEQVSIQHDHIHCLVRAPRLKGFHNFFRVLSGQIAQVFEKEGLLKNVTDTPKGLEKKGTGLWKYRVFSRVVRGYRALVTVKNYIQLNEKEVLGIIPYRKLRLKGLSSSEWNILWS